MNTAKRIALRLGVALIAAVLIAAPASAEVSATPSLRALARSLNAAGSPGAVVLVLDANGSRSGAAGYANLKTKERIGANHVFRVGSITKTFVATVVLQLVAEGTLTLDDPVERWLPGQIPNGPGITLRMLMNHTSGIYNYTEDEELFRSLVRRPLRVVTPAELLAVALKHGPRFAPGTSWSYSNTGYIVLGLVIEKATGIPLEAQLRERIFEPLGLTRTTLPAEATLARPFARGYLPPSNPFNPSPRGKPVDVTAWSPTWAWAAGALTSTAGDLARFYRALLGGSLLAAAQLQEMETMVPIPGSSGSGYGLGLASEPSGCGKTLGHTGGVPGYTSIAYSSEDGARQAVVLINTSPDSSRLGSRLFEAFRSAICR